MPNPIESLLSTGTKLWLDSVDPELVRSNLAAGATGATSNPIIVADLVATGRFDAQIERLVRQGLDDGQIAWQMTDTLVRDAQQAFLPVWERTGGDDGYVSFELDPLLEDPALKLAHAKRVGEYVRLGREWSAGHRNRMIKVPATPAGLDALEDLVAAGVTVNVTLVFTLAPVSAGPGGRVARRAAPQEPRPASRASTASSSPGSTSTPRRPCRSFRRPPRAWSASSTPSGFGPRTSGTGPSGPRR